jgi:hypothetical protein
MWHLEAAHPDRIRLEGLEDQADDVLIHDLAEEQAEAKHGWTSMSFGVDHPGSSVDMDILDAWVCSRQILSSVG